MDTRIKIITIVFLSMLFSSCSSIRTLKDNKVLNHVISIDRDGRLNEIPLAKAVDNRSKISHKHAHAHFKHILDGIRGFPKNAQGEVEILLYIHGGLNSKQESMQRAITHYQCITNDKKAAKYPVFVNWESGPLQTYGDHLVRIRQGEPAKSAPFTSSIYLLTDIANSLVNAPKSWLVNGEHSWRATVFRERKGRDRYLQDYKSGEHNVLYVGNGQQDGKLIRRAHWLATAPAKIVTTPFTYTMAKPAWDVMLRRTNTLFFTDEDYDNSHQIKPNGTLGRGALSVFLHELSDMVEEEQLKVNITLVGHSMGAIVVNRILGMEDIKLPYRNVVHMASADSIRNLFSKVVPYLNKHEKTEFYSMSLHPENEDREANFFGTVPSGSLLVWIDTMYTSPETVLDKRSGRWVNMERVLPTVPANIRDRMFFKIFGLHSNPYNKCDLQRQTQPLQHGDFNKLEYWKKSTWWQ